MLQFGTDGIRGDADTQLTTDLVAALARAFVKVTKAERVLVARDTRESGPRIERDLAAGFAAAGAFCDSVGVLPTPALALISRERSEWSAMISASHNKWSDNGIKFFAPGGTKLSDADQVAIESQLVSELANASVTNAAVEISEIASATDGYLRFLSEQVGAFALSGLRVVLDCANGAAFEVAPLLFGNLGAEVVVLHAEPNGRNINTNCGSTHTESLQRDVVSHGADIGFAFDGDADRVLAIDERGDLVDGDQIMAIMAIAMHERGELSHDAIAATVMSNLGMKQALAAHGVAIVETPVGDRNVVAAMQEHGLALGGEQSGHIVFGTRASTGDGLLTALLLANQVMRSQRSLSDLAAVMTRLPQILLSVRFDQIPNLAEAREVQFVMERERAGLGESGRVLVRSSGTEPLVRVMVEAATHEQAQGAAERIVDSLNAFRLAQEN